MLMWVLALRNILRNRRRTILTLLSMSGGYLLVSVMYSLNEGSYDQVLQYFTRDTTGHVQLTAPGYIERPNLYRTVAVSADGLSSLAALPEVHSVSARIESGALAYGEEKSLPVEVKGLIPEREAELSYLAEKITAGRYFTDQLTPDGLYEAMIGALTARQLNLSVGDDIVLLSQGADGSMANDLYRVTGILGDADAAESRWVVLPLQAAQAFFVLPEQAHRWLVVGEDYRRSEQVQQAVDTWVAGAGFTDPVVVSTWQEVAREFYELMEADKEGGMFASYILIFLVCVGVLNTVLMSVMERTGEFGVLKAIGTPPQRIFSLIVLETLLLALLGCGIGFLLAFPLNLWMSLVGVALAEPIDISGIVFSHYRGQMSLTVFLMPAQIIFVAAVLISLLPAWRASRLVPVDAMRAL
ncbi:ABC transporter permease [Salinispirillum marinum]|uniref:ABC transporter permease n=2 Tax=Saccharospirillaceae TaxID=255527 RepID=A0ABV8BDP1_9GAMM